MPSNEKDAENQKKDLPEKGQEVLETPKKIIENKSKNDEKKETCQTPETAKSSSSETVQKSKIDSKTKPKSFFAFLVLCVLFIFFLLFSTGFAFLNLNKTTIAKGVSIKGIDVSNLSIQQATAKIEEAIRIELALGMNLVYSENFSVDFDVSQIEYSYAITEAVKEAYSIGRSEHLFKNNYVLLATAFAGKNIELPSTYNEVSFNAIIDDIAVRIPRIGCASKLLYRR